ncbi:3-deoxy-7-phosphoheptulonate synthase [Xanthomonas oryzae pv. oryzae]|nr:3-deoxy-7-phosphoheptulonate synthase [Xanthomonas oryzae pv. oryzae]
MPPVTDDLRIRKIEALAPPSQLLSLLPCDERASETVTNARAALHKILHGRDDRLAVVIGPCSIHDPVAAMEYAQRLRPLRDQFGDALEIVMRVYFEKPRTTIGWKGLINDPDLDGSFQINKGLRVARGLLRDINNLGLPAGVEFLDIISPQYIADLVAWGAIGARTTESQVHREMASGLSCPVGFKNGTSGDVKIAVDAVGAASHPHHFLAVTKDGHTAVAATAGNPDCHVILRGGKQPNFDAANVEAASQVLNKSGLPARLMIDASHANSSKNPENQPKVIDDISNQLEAGETRIVGVMVESHLVGGRQELLPGCALTYGQSITDGCIGWDTSVQVLERLATAAARAACATDCRGCVSHGLQHQRWQRVLMLHGASPTASYDGATRWLACNEASLAPSTGTAVRRSRDSRVSVLMACRPGTSGRRRQPARRIGHHRVMTRFAHWKEGREPSCHLKRTGSNVIRPTRDLAMSLHVGGSNEV